ncbi:hypothetical protein [Nocardia sp. NPDC051570]|uniref:hypothetical protein n=1 Tax=Nocardia sp. NPDC051570 TaxID=3364324 RepID=UPI0037B5139B
MMMFRSSRTFSAGLRFGTIFAVGLVGAAVAAPSASADSDVVTGPATWRPAGRAAQR